MPSSQRRWGFFRSLLALSPLLLGLPAVSIWRHYALPAPLVDEYDAAHTPQLSEHAVLAHTRHLSEEIGFRTVGTREHARADAWMLGQAHALKALCDDAVRAEPGRQLECEVWHQQGSGSHRFDILGKRLYKTYVRLTNIVVRISNGTEEGKQHAVLANAHLDSTLPSPGAADDALAAGILLEAARTLVRTPHWSPAHALVLLWNNAEESLQDGSHLFATQHPVRGSVRAAINLEAAGSTGPELLFQATSAQMVDAYARVPRPYGTVVANDIFSSGVLMSDTDFRQFELYLDVTGLDMAVVGHSYFYHTRKDTVNYIEPGVAQHMGDNALALLRFLSSPDSPLPELTTGYSRPTTVYFSFLNAFFVQYSFATATALHLVLLASSVLLVAAQSANILGVLKGVALVGAALFSALASANIVALFMVHALHAPLSWFRTEYSCLLLYGPAALAGALASSAVLAPRLRINERTLFAAQLFAHVGLAVGVQSAGFGSAALFFLSGCSFFAGLALDAALGGGGQGRMGLGAYALGQAAPLLFGTELFWSVSDIFVPLTGRMGADSPADHIIASIVAVSGSYLFPLALPFVQRFGPQFLSRAAKVSALATGAAVLVFALRAPFDAMHPKRVFVIYNENITTNAVSLGVGTSDPAPGFDALVQDIAAFVGASADGNGNATVAEKVDMHEYNGDWDVLYPFSAFLSPYEIALAPHVSAYADGRFHVEAARDIVDSAAGTRALTLVVRHPGIIWTTIAFDAHVLSWSLDDSPPAEHTRHFVKEASFYGEDEWSIDLVVRLGDAAPPGGLQVNFVGVQETAMWPGKAREKAQGGRAMVLFEALDGWLEDHAQGTVDVTLLGCVGGVAVI
ncbi:hypothetical protein DFH11DRAFT_1842399 [Phellopilus nigrolimitatus]|nr:hypothetical protein DFH11DRAFT_1842399 [Phellopilus nigrolimitatus]